MAGGRRSRRLLDGHGTRRSTARRVPSATRFGRSAASISPPTKRSARSSAPSTKRYARTASKRSGESRSLRLWTDAFPQRSSTRGRGRAACTYDAAPRLAGERSGAEFVEHHRVESLSELEADRVLIATDGYPSGLLGDFEGLSSPPGVRWSRRNPSPERSVRLPPLRSARLRILAAARGWPDHGGWLPRRRHDHRVHCGRSDHANDPGRARRLPRPNRWPPAHVTHRWAGIFGLVLDFFRSSARLRHQPGAWVCGGYSGHGNVLGFMCGDLVAKAMLGEEHPLLALFDPERLLAAA